MKNYEVVIIGAGPAGLIAAIAALRQGARVLILEKNTQPGLKLLTTGGGRCNLTNDIRSPRLLAASYGDQGKFLLSALNSFGVSETLDFFHALGIKTKVEKNNQVFPISDQARTVLSALVTEIENLGGELKCGVVVKKLVKKNNRLQKIILNSGLEIIASNYILTTGGQSYPLTGSTGDGFGWLEGLGHQVVARRPVLTPILVADKFVSDLEGLSLKDVTIKLTRAPKKIISLSGDLIFTAQGLSGPVIFDLSRYIVKPYKDFQLSLDIFPNYNSQALDEFLQKRLQLAGKKILRNSFEGLIPARLLMVIGDLLNLNLERSANTLAREERLALGKILKNLTFSVRDLGGFSQAMVTAGGLELKEVDSRTLRSKLIENLFVAGEVLDLDGPTGGYNLQICWTTGYIAGRNAAEKS